MTIHELAPGRAPSADEVTLSATVSKGTYIRSLARDIAQALGTVGHVTMLQAHRPVRSASNRRFRWTFWTKPLRRAQLDGAVLPLDAGLDDIPALPVTPDQAQLLRHGQRLFGIPAMPGLHLATDGGRPVALVEVSADGLKVVRGFNL